MLKSVKVFLFRMGLNQERAEKLFLDVNKYYRRQEREKIGEDGKPRLNPDGTVATRIINPSYGELKRVQTKIKKEFLDKIELPTCVMGGVKGKSNIENAAKHLGKKYKFKTDLKNFFPSISHKQVYSALIHAGFSENIARYITRFTTYKGSLPQGTPTSTHLANLVFLSTDSALLEFYKSRNITYSRFVDDLCFSSSVNFCESTPKLLNIVRENSFQINQAKTKYCYFQEITGICVPNNRLIVPQRLLSKIELFSTMPEKAQAYHALTQYYFRIVMFKSGSKNDRGKFLERK